MNKYVQRQAPKTISALPHWLYRSCMYGCLFLAISTVSVTDLYAHAEKTEHQATKQENTPGKVTYKGTVIDDTDMPLPGVNVTYKDAKGTGTITNADGEFTITVPDNVHNLIFSYVGMKTQTVRVAETTGKIKVRMEPDAVALKETVVTGIYTRKAESFTGSMATYTAKELKTVGNVTYWKV